LQNGDRKAGHILSLKEFTKTVGSGHHLSSLEKDTNRSEYEKNNVNFHADSIIGYAAGKL
jgi:hypothetical protein